MSQETSIEWTDVSWNPVHGCSKVSPGCAHCYAETLSLRYGHTRKPWTPANAPENVVLKPKRLGDPLSGRKPFDRPCMVFVNSMSDLFHELVPDEYIARVFATMALAPEHTFQVLTKRPERMVELLSDQSGFWANVWAEAADRDKRRLAAPVLLPNDRFVLTNVWLGTSIENRRFVDRADRLRETPAAVRFVSAEPLLGPLVITPPHDDDYTGVWPHGDLDLTGIDWLIAGGESGAGHRRLDLRWVRDLRDLCSRTGTAFFMKQLGGARPGGKLEELPEDLRVREMPRQLALEAA